jgi:23S rRNA (adenine-N6)-dimethyltransferase
VSGRKRARPRHPPYEPEPLRWGWHRLSDPAAARVVAAADVRPGDLVVDLGAGDGALTRPLLDAGARVLAVELHPRRCDLLRSRFAADAVTVVQADVRMLRLPREPFRVVANPPYTAWRALLRALLARESRLVGADVVLERRVVRRIVQSAAATPRRGRGFVVERGLAVPRGCFSPPPRVDSAVLRIRRQR